MKASQFPFLYDSAMPDIDASPEFARARKLFSTGQYRRARRPCLAALKREPNNARIIALLARIDAQTKRTTFEQSLSIVAALTVQQPDDARLQVAATVLRFPLVATDKDSRTQAVLELRGILAHHPEDAYVQQVLAGFLGCDMDTLPEAWELYKTAMNSEPLQSPCYRAAAHVLAKRYEPALSEQVFVGMGPVERAAVRTRSLGPMPMFAVIFILAFSAISLHSTGNLTLSVPLMTMATVWGGWSVYVNSVMCCKKCRNAWMFLITALWVAFIVAKGLSWIIWLVFASAALITMWLRIKQVSNSAEQSSVTAGR